MLLTALRQPSVPRSMLLTLLALLPGTLASLYVWGPGVLGNLAGGILGALLAEALLLRLRARPLHTLYDGSALLSGALLALSLPPGADAALSLGGSALAMILGKQLFGGLGHNPFNPAMLAYAALLIGAPQAMTAWPLPLAGVGAVDGISGATLLDAWRNAQRAPLPWAEFAERANLAGLLVDGRMNQAQMLSAAWALGGAVLLTLRIIPWQLPVAVLAGLLLPAGLLYALDPAGEPPPSLHLWCGATVFGALFIATDPVSGATTPRGRWLFGLGCGLLCWLIRRYGAYADGFAFAILLMNLCVPWLDRLRPRVIGHAQRWRQR